MAAQRRLQDQCAVGEHRTPVRAGVCCSGEAKPVGPGAAVLFMQQFELPDVPGRIERRAGGQQRWRDDGNHHGVDQALRLGARPARPRSALANGELGLVGPELDDTRVGFDPHLDIGKQRTELDQVGNHPERRESRLDADRDAPDRILRHDCRQRGIDPVERVRQHFTQRLPVRRQRDGSVKARKQRMADRGFKLPDLPADRRLRDEELLRRLRETQQPGSDFETPQCRQR